MAYSSANGLANKAVLQKYVMSLIQSESRFVSRSIPTAETAGIRAGVLAVQDVDSDGPEDLLRGKGDPYYPIGRDLLVDDVAFSCADRGATEVVDEIDRRDLAGITAKLLQLEQGKLQKATIRLLENEEKRLGTVLGTTGNWGRNLVGNVDFAYFDGSSPANPLKVFSDAADLGGRFDANTIIFGSRAVYDATVGNSLLVAGLPTNAFGALASPSDLGTFLSTKIPGINNVYVMRATGRANRNPASATRAGLGGNWIWVGYMASQEDMVVTPAGSGKLETSASGILRVQAFAPEVGYTQIGMTHHYSVFCPSDFVVPSASLGTIITALLDP